jgi:F-type H+/Na+-transporting ATPase subunit beta
VVSVRSGAVDIRFADNLPSIYSVLRKGVEKRVLVEVLTGKEESEIFETGIKIIDVLLPLELNGKAGLFGMPGVGKTVLLTEIIHNRIGRQDGVKVFCGIGEARRAQGPGSAVTENIVLSPDMVMIFGQMRNKISRPAQTGSDALSAVEPQMDGAYHEAPSLIDSLFRLLHTGMMGGALPEDDRAITSIQAVQVLSDGFSDPAFMQAFSQLSACMVLSKKRAQEGFFPAIDPLQSHSRLTSPKIMGARHYALAMDIRRTLAHYAELKETIAVMGASQLSIDEVQIASKARQLEHFLTQPFFTTEQFTGLKGKFVSLKDALDGCERILRDEFRDVSEKAFYMIGSISEATQKKDAYRAHPL